MGDAETQKTGRQYKDTVFRALFSDSARFLELYNAVTDGNIPADTAITPCPLNPLLARFNDLAALIGTQLVVFFEHQSTISYNMPLRLLSYVTDILYQQIVDRDKLYGSTRLPIPTPKFYILYNGEQELKDRVMRLSDSFIEKDAEPSLELVAKVVNINFGSGETALNRSASLKGYSFLIAEIQENIQSGMTRDNAIIAAIETCIDQNVLRAFLKSHYWEVVKMLNYEYDAEADRRIQRQEGRKEGQIEGRIEDRCEMIKLMVEIQQGNISVEEALRIARESAPLMNN